MTVITAILAVTNAALTVLVASGCYRPPTSSQNIVLNGFSNQNYVLLERYIGNKICITGKLSIDSMGVYYQLQPTEEENIIHLSFSRINTGLNRSLTIRKGLNNGSVQTICGLLKDTTPFKGCDTNDCKWYALTDAEPRRKGSGFRGHRP